jgi:hypothetical protein
VWLSTKQSHRRIMLHVRTLLVEDSFITLTDCSSCMVHPHGRLFVIKNIDKQFSSFRNDISVSAVTSQCAARLEYEGVSKSFRTESIAKYTLTFGIAR